jgi:spore coat protein A
MPQAADGSVDPDGPHNLVMAPAERADLIIDFSSCLPGDKLILYNGAPAPFPGGDVRNDYFTGDPDRTWQNGAPSTVPGKGPNTRTLMQIQVVALQGAADPMNFTNTLSALQASTGLPKAYNDSHIPYGEPDLNPAVFDVHETKTLNEDFDDYGRLIQRVGTGNMLYTDSYGRNYTDPPTEAYANGTTAVWDIYNTTGDTHPMHFHLVNVQVVGRLPFAAVGDQAATANSSFIPPEPNYQGWKETVRMNPGEVTRVIMKFSLPSVPFVVPLSPRLGGHEYVWHCHILEHEEHDMMRPIVITP